MPCDLGVVGPGVMGGNLALNMERNGFRIAGYDGDSAKARALVAGPAADRHVSLAESPSQVMVILLKPRRALMMVASGPPVDSAIAHLRPRRQARRVSHRVVVTGPFALRESVV